MASRYAIETIFRAIDNMTAPVRRMEASVGKFGVTGNLMNSALKTSFANAERSLNKMVVGVKNAVVGLEAAGVAAAAVFATNGVKNAIEFEQTLAKLSTIAPDLSLDKASKDILAVSNSMHVAVVDITESTYNAISSGIEASKAVDFVATATKAAKAGFADTSTAIDGLTNIMNAYGMSADSAMRIADQMLVTQNLGKATFTDMANGMGQVAPIASSLNVRTEELFASIAALTNAGIQTPQAITGLKAAFSNIMKPAKQASDLAERLGLDFSAAALQTKGWVGFLDDIKAATGGDAEMMAKLFGSVEALNAVTVLTGKGADKLTESLEAMSTMAGITEKSFERMMQTPQERIAGLKNQFTNAGIKLGQALLPVLEKVADKVELFISKIDSINFDKVAESVGRIVDFVLGLIQTVWTLRTPIITVTAAVLAFKGVMVAIVVATKTWTAISTVAKGAQLAYAIVIKGNTAAMSAFAFETKAVQVATELFSAVMRGVGWVKATASIVAHKVATLAMTAAQGVATAATTAFSAAVNFLNAAFIASPIGWVVLGIIALIAVVVLCVKHWDEITAAISAAWEKLTQFAAFIWDGLCGAFAGLWEKLTQFATFILDGLCGAVVLLWEKLTQFVAFIWDGVCGAFTAAAEAIKSVFLLAIESVWQPIQRIIDAFTDGGIIGGIREIGTTILKAVLSPVLSLMDTLSKIPGIGGKIGDVKVGILDKIEAISSFGEDRDSEKDKTAKREKGEKNAFTSAPRAFTPYAAAQVSTQHTETNRSEMNISLEKGLRAQVYGKAPGITVQTQKTGTFD